MSVLMIRGLTASAACLRSLTILILFCSLDFNYVGEKK